MKLISTSLLFIFCIMSVTSTAQLSVGICRGTAFYQGDVSEPSLLRLKDYNAATGGFLKYQLTDVLSLRTSFIKSTLSGRDKNYVKIEWRQKRGFQFKSPITEILQSIDYDVFSLKLGNRRSYKTAFLSFYVTGGLGYLKTNPEVDYNEPNAVFERVSIDKFANYNRSHLTAALGAGIKWHITANEVLIFDTTNRTAFTDYLDGISNAAQPKFGDWYFMSMLSFSHQFSWKSKGRNGIPNTFVACPKF